ncbi:MAG TPA: GNAT family N-acetyltransferase [Actinomycetota bacterium]|nr:GNAT family N-acetyltransferase [Actinomycetota bacterium]
MDVVFSEDGRDFARRDWSSLVTADPAGTFFHTPQYLKLYWEEFAEQPEHLLLAFVEDDGVQVGAVAFERLGERLRFLGGTEVTDYMGPVALPELRDTVAKELLAGLGRRMDWRSADLRGLAEDRAWLQALAEAAATQGVGVEVTDDQNGVAPFVPIPGSYDQYLAGLPSKLRHEIKRKARKLETEGGPYRVSVAQRDTLEEHLDRFVELHRTSEGPKGVFMQPGMEIFFRRLGEAFLPRGIFNLTFIEVGGEKIAGTIGFRHEGTFYLYNSAFDRAWQHLSPGMVLVAEDIRIAIEAGCSGFDLLKGDYAYKYRFGATPRPVKRLLITR